jgi:hypothetical protein
MGGSLWPGKCVGPRAAATSCKKLPRADRRQNVGMGLASYSSRSHSHVRHQTNDFQRDSSLYIDAQLSIRVEVFLPSNAAHAISGHMWHLLSHN